MSEKEPDFFQTQARYIIDTHYASGLPRLFQGLPFGSVPHIALSLSSPTMSGAGGSGTARASQDGGEDAGVSLSCCAYAMYSSRELAAFYLTTRFMSMQSKKRRFSEITQQLSQQLTEGAEALERENVELKQRVAALQKEKEEQQEKSVQQAEKIQKLEKCVRMFEGLTEVMLQNLSEAKANKNKLLPPN